MSAILVTGATGNVGAEVLRLLIARGADVRAGVRDVRRPLGAETVMLDFERPETFAAALRGIDQLFLMRPPAISNVARDVFPLIDAAKAAGVTHIVFLSILGAEKMPVIPHRQIEAYLETSGIPYSFLRASFFMQNLSTTHAAEIRERDEIFVPAGKGTTSFIDVRDLAEIAVKLMTEPLTPNQAYPLTGSEALDYYQVAASFSEVLGRRITYRSPGLLRFLLRQLQAGTPLGFALVMGGIYTTARLGKAGLVTPDAETLLGRAPRTMRGFIEESRAAWERSPEG